MNKYQLSSFATMSTETEDELRARSNSARFEIGDLTLEDLDEVMGGIKWFDKGKSRIFTD